MTRPAALATLSNLADTHTRGSTLALAVEDAWAILGYVEELQAAVRRMEGLLREATRRVPGESRDW